MHDQGEILISAKGICVEHESRQILDNVDIAVNRGQIVALIGPNGAGKTTLVRILLGLQSPTKGSITRSKQLRIGYMPQSLSITSNMPLTVERFLQLATTDTKAIHAVIEEVNAKQALHSQLGVISGGELQRVLLARALLSNPSLLVLDEPAQGVDLNGQDELYALIKKVAYERNAGALIVSHDMHFVMKSTDEVVCLNHHICCSGHPESISQHPEYLNLFGRRMKELALYTHHHDHEHDISGDVVNTDRFKG